MNFKLTKFVTPAASASAYLHSDVLVVKGTHPSGAPTGLTAQNTQTADANGDVTFTGLTSGTRYWAAWDTGGAVYAWVAFTPGEDLALSADDARVNFENVFTQGQTIDLDDAADIGLRVQAAASQTADLFVAEDSAGVDLVRVLSSGTLWASGEVEIDGALNHDGTTVGLFGVAPATRPAATDEIKAALASLGILTDGGASPLNLDAGQLDAGIGNFSGLLSANAGLTVAGALTLPVGSVETEDLADAAVTFAKVQDIATDRLLGRDTAASGDVEEVTVGGGLEFTGTGGIQRSALTGDIEAAAGSGATAIAAGVIVNADVNAAAAIAHSKLAAITAGQVLLGSPTNVPTATALSGDVTVDSSGVTTLASIAGALNHDGSTVGLYGVVPVARSAGWTITNDTADRTFDANAASLEELSDVVATLIRDVAATGLVGAVA